MSEQDINKPENEAYTVKIIPSEGETTTSFTLSAGMVRYVKACAVAGALLFVGSFAFSSYNASVAHKDQAAVQEMQAARQLQQEQLSKVMKRINELQDEMDKLDKQESELKLMAFGGSQPAKAEPKKAAGGVGGAVAQPSAKELDSLLDDLEKRLLEKRQNIAQMEAVLQEHQKNASYEVNVLARRPVGMPADGEISSPYGMRWGGSDFHPGVDIADDFGTPIYATAAGVVTYAGWNDGGYGNMVEIDHGNGIETLYAHAQEVVVRDGQEVKQGDLIALMGSTGFSTGPHVHYEITINGERVNPNKYF